MKRARSLDSGSTAEDKTHERKLWLRVLMIALGDATGTRSVIGLQNPRARKAAHEDALLWLHSDETNVGSYCWICQMLAYDYEYMRECVHNNMSVTGLYVHK